MVDGDVGQGPELAVDAANDLMDHGPGVNMCGQEGIMDILTASLDIQRVAKGCVPRKQEVVHKDDPLHGGTGDEIR